MADPSPQLKFFAPLHSIFITPRGQICIILPILLRFFPIILDSGFGPPIILKIIPE